jgi:hypothetical protein
LVFDCSFELSSPDAGTAMFAESHIPGAVYAHVDTALSAKGVCADLILTQVPMTCPQFPCRCKFQKLTVRYGAKTIDLSGKGKSAIEIASAAQLVPTLALLKAAAEAGELDAAIEVAGAAQGLWQVAGRLPTLLVAWYSRRHRRVAAWQVGQGAVANSVA